MRIFRLLAFFCLGLLLGGFSVYASAASSSFPAQKVWGTSNGSEYLSNASACSAQIAYENTYTAESYTCSFSGIGSTESTCNKSCTTPSNASFTGASNIAFKRYTCPGSSTLSSDTCYLTCPDGQTGNDQGQCVTPCVSGQSGPPGTFTGTGDFPSSLCINGCSYGWTGVGVQIGNTWALGAGKGTGQSCTGSTPQSNPIPPEDPKTKCVEQGKGFGTVNGVTVCTTPTATKQSNTSSSSSSNTSTSGGTSTSTTTTGTTTSTTTCTGDTCTTTTTNSSSTSGGAQGTVTGQQETTKTESKADFCKDNPTNKICSGQEQEDYCAKNPDALSCMKAGTPTEEGALQTVDKSIISSIIPVSVSGVASCPADIQLPKGAKFSFEPACMYATALKPFVLISAWIVAGLIVFGMSSKV